MFSSRGTVRYEKRGQGYRDVEKVGKHCYTRFDVLTVEATSVTVFWNATCILGHNFGHF